jgi:hypothetical protein
MLLFLSVCWCPTPRKHIQNKYPSKGVVHKFYKYDIFKTLLADAVIRCADDMTSPSKEHTANAIYNP